MKRAKYRLISAGLKLSGWLQYGRNHEAPVRPDRILRIDPTDVVHKPDTKPPTGPIPPTLIASGEWDTVLVPIEEDIVYRVFRDRFVEGRAWEETEYVEFLRSNVSEHGGLSRSEALERCERLDELYRYIEAYGYRSQTRLERKGSLIDGLSGSIRPPTYREVAVNVTRDGEFVWHAGMHRLVIAQLLELETIPVRINTRHEQWQEIRDTAYRGETVPYADHPDVEYLYD